AGWRVLFSLSAERVGKQFSAAESAGATFAVILGAEWPMLKIKRLSTREENIILKEELLKWLAQDILITSPEAYLYEQ
ncbi:MAG TPA: His/Gly/Thr/Pro-type tRNA ligase C-terminal domain-containing protein, partial [Chthoniobacterales bacterium]|nr:His/Gly/Thr/Pro-type tRNA ligase C-terminal domain-containing protein [Chthoniobacterales bacterium]